MVSTRSSHKVESPLNMLDAPRRCRAAPKTAPKVKTAQKSTAIQLKELRTQLNEAQDTIGTQQNHIAELESTILEHKKHCNMAPPKPSRPETLPPETSSPTTNPPRTSILSSVLGLLSPFRSSSPAVERPQLTPVSPRVKLAREQISRPRPSGQEDYIMSEALHSESTEARSPMTSRITTNTPRHVNNTETHDVIENTQAYVPKVTPLK
ncbi:hypothetical protein LTS18_010368, partial [Coniosporium uncinatum]